MQKTENFNPLISVIMNCHNGEEYLSQSIESLINQTYENWELIFFNNFSEDKSVLLANSYKDKRIKIFHSHNFINLYKARNKALKKTQGDLISFLDTDDIWEKDKIEKQVNFLKNNLDYSMVYSNFFTLEEASKKKKIHHNINLPEGEISKKIVKKYCIGMLTVCVKKEIFNQNLFDDNLNIIGDFDFFINHSLTNKIGCIQEPLATYRIHKNNYSKKKLNDYINELNRWIKKNDAKFKEKGLTLIHQKFFLFKMRLKLLLQNLGV